MDEKIKIRFAVLFGAVIVLFICLVWQANDTMTVCQLSHSHDVCFQALNR